MTTTRTPIKRKSKLNRITPESLEAYKRARKLYDTSKVDEWGQLSDQCRAACSDLHAILGRDACDRDIMDTIGVEEMPTKIPYDCWWTPETWEEAVAIRRELERLTK
jgi:hypothetical protein